MGRRPKTGVEYFQHDVDMRNSNSVKSLKMIIGRNNAIAFLSVLFELLGQSERFYLDCSDPYIWRVFTAEVELPDAEATKCIDTLATMGTIDAAYWEQKKIIWCPAYIDRLKLHMNRKHTKLGPPPIHGSIQSEDIRKRENADIEETAFGAVEIDHDWARVEDSYAQQIGDLPYGLYLDKLRDLYESLGADIVILAIEYTNEKQPSNMRIYLQRILENWKKAGVQTIAQAQAKITEHENRSNAQRRAQEAPPPPPDDGEPVKWVI